jgi:23S rRNA (uracil1939-C5)-methyltransferase
MINKNDTIKTTILNYGCNAEGVANVYGQVVFIPYTLTGEEITATIISGKKNFLIGKATEIEAKNPNRVPAPCPYFSKCGGCQLQHANYNHSTKIKQQIVLNAIKNIGKINCEVMSCVPSENEYHYRNKVALPINPKTRCVGMYRTSTHHIVDIESCILLRNGLNKLISVFNEYLKISKTSIYDEETKKGTIKHLVAREVEGKILVTVVINSGDLPDSDVLVKLLKQNFENFALNLNINKLNNNVILSNTFKEIYGNSTASICENGINYSINNQSFLQVNENIKSLIYGEVFKEIEGGVVVDAYSGAGLLSAMMAKHAKFVYGIEIIKPATEIANKLKEQNGIENLENINGDCAVELPKLLKKLSAGSKEKLTMVLDPPKKGCDKVVLNSIVDASPQKIVYVSCNPSTLARDLSILTKNGDFEVTKIQPYDMFPQTKHVETLAILKKK